MEQFNTKHVASYCGRQRWQRRDLTLTKTFVGYVTWDTLFTLYTSARRWMSTMLKARHLALSRAQFTQLARPFGEHTYYQTQVSHSPPLPLLAALCTPLSGPGPPQGCS